MKVELPYDPLVDLGKGSPIILLHGLLGGVSNWKYVIDDFRSTHRVLVPRLPLYLNPITTERLQNLVDYLDSFIEAHGFNKVILMGNSLGGHIALLYGWKKPGMVEKLVLTGSSCHFENSFGGSFPHVKDHSFIKEKVESTFLKREVATKARTAQRNNSSDLQSQITFPVLLVWGLQDNITPPSVALEFHNLLPDSRIALIDNCGQVPMIEKPELFNKHVRSFLH